MAYNPKYDSPYSIMLDLLKVNDSSAETLRGVSEKLDALASRGETVNLDVLRELLKDNRSETIVKETKVVEQPIQTTIIKEKEIVAKPVEVEKVIEKTVYQDRIVEKPVPVEIEKVVFKDRVVEKPVDRVVYRDRIVEKPVEKVVVKEKVVTKTVEKPVVRERVIYKYVKDNAVVHTRVTPATPGPSCNCRRNKRGQLMVMY